MREIKFRAWSEPLKKMDYSPLNAITFDGKVYFGNADITGFHNEVMQYTGMKDKNGEEIYEGDVVKFLDDNSVIEWDIKSCSFRIISAWSTYTLRQAHHNDIEIIGNIHENPELLEVQE